MSKAPRALLENARRSDPARRLCEHLVRYDWSKRWIDKDTCAESGSN